jgi:hypothetical protein
MKIKKNGQVVTLTESDLNVIIKRIINESVNISISSLTKSNNKIKGLTNNLKEDAKNFGLDVNESDIQNFLNRISEELNKKNSIIVDLINGQKYEQVGEEYMSVVVKVYKDTFNNKVGFVNKGLIRVWKSEKEIREEIKPYLVGKIIFKILRESVESFPIDEKGMEKIRNKIFYSRVEKSEELINWSLKQIYG